MNINATLIIQAFNFWIAYFIVRFLALSPAYERIKQKRSILAQGQQSIQEAQVHEHALQEKRYQMWSAIHRIFIHKAPIDTANPVPPAITSSSKDSISAPSHDDRVIQEVRDYIVTYLKECR